MDTENMCSDRHEEIGTEGTGVGELALIGNLHVRLCGDVRLKEHRGLTARLTLRFGIGGIRDVVD